MFMWMERATSDVFSEATTAAPEPTSSERLDTYRCEGVPGRAQVDLASFLYPQRCVRLAKPQVTSGQAHRVLVEHLLKVPLCAGLWKESGDKGDRSADGPNSSPSWGHRRQYLLFSLVIRCDCLTTFCQMDYGHKCLPVKSTLGALCALSPSTSWPQIVMRNQGKIK